MVLQNYGLTEDKRHNDQWSKCKHLQFFSFLPSCYQNLHPWGVIQTLLHPRWDFARIEEHELQGGIETGINVFLVVILATVYLIILILKLLGSIMKKLSVIYCPLSPSHHFLVFFSHLRDLEACYLCEMCLYCRAAPWSLGWPQAVSKYSKELMSLTI